MVLISVFILIVAILFYLVIYRSALADVGDDDLEMAEEEENDAL